LQQLAECAFSRIYPKSIDNILMHTGSLLHEGVPYPVAPLLADARWAKAARRTWT